MLISLYLVTARKRPEILAIAVASFLAHIASDTGVFAFYAPISFNYVSMSEFRIPLIVGAVSFAILAGTVKSSRMRQLSQSGPIEVKA